MSNHFYFIYRLNHGTTFISKSNLLPEIIVDRKIEKALNMREKETQLIKFYLGQQDRANFQVLDGMGNS